eukprot:s2729_g7.t1
MQHATYAVPKEESLWNPLGQESEQLHTAFRVEAVVEKENRLSDSEKENLGPLGQYDWWKFQWASFADSQASRTQANPRDRSSHLAEEPRGRATPLDKLRSTMLAHRRIM